MNRQRILDSVKSPADVKELSEAELSVLAQEIRQQIIATTSQTGGHVASSLGAVEIIVALHSLLETPQDKIVFDVGHQAYAHKLLTGRLDEFSSLRTYGGLSGFPRPSESDYDVHPSGHASDSLSIAAGLAKARVLNGSDEKIVAVIGDASMGGGMAFEALNYIGQEQLPMVIILNDNEMSISANVGALVKHLGNVRATKFYRKSRDAIQERMEKSMPFGAGLVAFGKNAKDSIKQMAIPRATIFEQLNIVCTPPIDGHDIGELREMLATVLEMDAPALVHVVTRKGKGYEPARQDPERFHGVGPYDIKTGASTKPAAQNKTYTQVFGETLVREAEQDKSIVALTAAMCGGTGLKAFSKRFPQRFIDVGIAEEQALGMAAGLAIAGKKPIVAIYSTFLQRAVDQVVIDCALENEHVVFALDRAGLVGDDGPTHHGVFDLVYLRMIPHMKILTPSDEAELAHALHTAIALDGPVALRYPRGEGVGAPVPEQPELLEVGKSRVVREGGDVAILAFGRLVDQAKAAAELLAEGGIEARVVDMRWAKPLDEEAIEQAAETKLVVTLEEGVTAGGVGEGVLEVLAKNRLSVPTLVLGIPDRFVQHGSVSLLFKEIGLDPEGIAASIAEAL